MTNGTLNLITNGGERKMHYLFDGEKYYFLTKEKSNKVRQIRNDNVVRIDLDDNKYLATIYTDIKVVEIKAMFQESLKGFSKFMNKYVGKKNNAAIILVLKHDK